MAELPNEALLTPAQIADRWQVSVDTVVRVFGDEPGVLNLSAGSRGRGKRAYRLLRIPETVLRRVEKSRMIQ
jgi:hypothetical protein